MGNTRVSLWARTKKQLGASCEAQRSEGRSRRERFPANFGISLFSQPFLRNAVLFPLLTQSSEGGEAVSIFISGHGEGEKREAYRMRERAQTARAALRSVGLEACCDGSGRLSCDMMLSMLSVASKGRMRSAPDPGRRSRQKEADNVRRLLLPNNAREVVLLFPGQIPELDLAIDPEFELANENEQSLRLLLVSRTQFFKGL